MLNKEYDILEPFTRQPWKKLTFRQVKMMSGNSSVNYVHSTLKRFVTQDLLREEKIGNVVEYHINQTTHSLGTFGFVAEHKANRSKHLPHENIEKLTQKIKTAYYTVLITGSYARKKQNEYSDIDVIIICDNKCDCQAILASIKLSCRLMIPQVHPYVFKESEFFKMLVDKEQNYGKETARNSLIITGAKQYYAILGRAMNNGFNG